MKELFAWVVMLGCIIAFLFSKRLNLKADFTVMLAFVALICSSYILFENKSFIPYDDNYIVHNETYISNFSSTGETVWMTTDTILFSDVVDTNYHINYKRVMDKLGKRESSNNYYAINKYGYIGRYQFGSLAMRDIGSPSHAYFLRNIKLFTPEKQDRCMIALLNRNSYYLRNYKHYVGKEINGITITWEGLLQACHLVGNGNVKKYLTSNGKHIAKDANGTSLEEYLQL